MRPGSRTSCCVPGSTEVSTAPAPPAARRPRSTKGQIRLAGGVFGMGDHFGEGYPADGETPVHAVDLDPFWIDEATVTNAAFAAFVKQTGYDTVAERLGTSMVFHLAMKDQTGSHVLGAVEQTPWWLVVQGADWRHPEGPGSDVSRRSNHPVVHVAHQDAAAFAAWAGKRLPTEAEWEYAARGGLEGARYAWGDELVPKGRHQCNIWQGAFPVSNDLEDGWLTTAPAKSYRPNGFGTWQQAGNVWEWCADWFAADYYARSPRHSPPGPESGTERIMRGGSFLCHASYCHRYRVAARSRNTPDSTAANVGFRCANDD